MAQSPWIYGCGPTPWGAEVGSYSDAAKDKGKPRFLPAWQWRATTRPGKIYVHVFDWPAGKLELPTVRGTVTSAYLLADPDQGAVGFTQTDHGVSITLPEAAPSKVATVVCLAVDPER
ncbi:hypothetical protein Pla175_22580 [Pirellulimonas nuda]|uniref:Alpha-L-fucosidase C-terminal domain-containing protein n=1 Tax=Pirellulimonas nuda TaxID=2528009 RepID=A0A518DBL7_9BACT|nr:hypothetical protein [Pirellulimonas nuda]QDU88874.1 hypothetical protein Pla175_22580 [Pirellulimonas nuda]